MVYKCRRFFAKYFRKNILDLYYADSVSFNVKKRQFVIKFNDIPFFYSRWITHVQIFNTCKRVFYFTTIWGLLNNPPRAGGETGEPAE